MLTKTELKKSIEKMEPEEVLEYLGLFLGRVDVGMSFVQNEDGAITHNMCIFSCEDKILASAPSEFEWPLMMMPRPNALTPNEEKESE